MINHLAFGIVIDDIVLYTGEQHLGILGGGGPQTAWGMAAALGSGETVGIVSEVGHDLPQESLTPLINAGINLDGLTFGQGQTPRAWQKIDADGSRHHVWSVPPREAMNSVIPPSYQDAKQAHWGLHPENPALAFATELTEQGKQISLETFKPPEQPLSPEALEILVQSCYVFSPSWSEASGIIGSTDYQEVIDGFRKAGCQILALRRGAEGADVWDFARNTGIHVPAIPTHVIDTVGGGNAFCGALLVTLDQGIERAACHAVTAASYMIEQIGMPRELPDRSDYERRFTFARERIQKIK